MPTNVTTVESLVHDCQQNAIRLGGWWVHCGADGVWRLAHVEDVPPEKPMDSKALESYSGILFCPWCGEELPKGRMPNAPVTQRAKWTKAEEPIEAVKEG